MRELQLWRKSTLPALRNEPEGWQWRQEESLQRKGGYVLGYVKTASSFIPQQVRACHAAYAFKVIVDHSTSMASAVLPSLAGLPLPPCPTPAPLALLQHPSLLLLPAAAPPAPPIIRPAQLSTERLQVGSLGTGSRPSPSSRAPLAVAAPSTVGFEPLRLPVEHVSPSQALGRGSEQLLYYASTRY